MAFKIKVDNTCIGCGSCEAICPETFEMEGDIAKTKKSTVEKLTYEEEAKEACPSESIKIEKV